MIIPFMWKFSPNQKINKTFKITRRMWNLSNYSNWALCWRRKCHNTEMALYLLWWKALEITYSLPPTHTHIHRWVVTSTSCTQFVFVLHARYSSAPDGCRIRWNINFWIGTLPQHGEDTIHWNVKESIDPDTRNMMTQQFLFSHRAPINNQYTAHSVQFCANGASSTNLINNLVLASISIHFL